jgi:hypothetical protein
MPSVTLVIGQLSMDVGKTLFQFPGEFFTPHLPGPNPALEQPLTSSDDNPTARLRKLRLRLELRECQE